MECDPLELDERTCVDLIEDILRSTPGLHYRLDIFDRLEQEEGAPFAAFAIETNPDYELEVSILIGKDGLRLLVNDQDFSVPLDDRRRLDRWIERRCRDIERLVQGDLKLEFETILGRYLSTDLFVGRDDRWVDIAERDDGWGWIGLLAWFLPFGILPLRTRELVYRSWYELGGEPEPTASD